jgi:hypothetical protein
MLPLRSCCVRTIPVTNCLEKNIEAVALDVLNRTKVLMKNVIQRVIDTIRARSRDEWQSFFQGKVADIREYARAHGERAALIAFGLGIFLVLCFKLALVLACLAVLAYQLILIISDNPKD